MKRMWPWLLGAGGLVLFFASSRKGSQADFDVLGGIDLSEFLEKEASAPAYYVDVAPEETPSPGIPSSLPPAWMNPYYQAGMWHPKDHEFPAGPGDWQWSIPPRGKSEETAFLDKVLALIPDQDWYTPVKITTLEYPGEKAYLVVKVFVTGYPERPRLLLEQTFSDHDNRAKHEVGMWMGNGLASFNHLFALLKKQADEDPWSTPFLQGS